MSSPKPPERPPNPLERLTSGGWVKGLMRLGIGVVLVAVVLHFAGTDSLRHLANPRLLPLILGGALIHLVQRAARMKKWQIMLGPTCALQRPFSYLLRVQLIGMVANLAVPVSEAVKVWAVARGSDAVKVSAKSIVVDMALHTSLVGAVGVVSATLAGWYEPALWVVALIMMLGPLVVIAVARRWPAPPAEGGAIVDNTARVWGLAAVETVCQVSLYAIAFHAIGVRVSTLQVLALAPVLYIVDLLNFTPSGLGLREALFAGVLEVMPEASSDVGVAAGLVISSMLLSATLVGGGVALLLPAPAEDAAQ